jgi:hypothetical protein
MKVLIQDLKTELYLAYQGGWTDQPRDAKDMAFTVHALQVAKNLALKNFQVLFYFPDSNYQVVVSDSEPSPCTTPEA